MQASRITPTPDSLAYQGKPAPQRHLPITMTIRTSEHRDRPSVRLSLRAHAPRFALAMKTRPVPEQDRRYGTIETAVVSGPVLR
jgi:hypothetical protein